MLQRTNDLLKTSTAEFKVPSSANGSGNGHGLTVICGRGLKHRSLKTRVALAVEAIAGNVAVTNHSRRQAAADFHLPLSLVWKAAGKSNGRSNGHTSNTSTGIAAEITNNTVMDVTASTPTMSDTPAIRVALRRLAASLGCTIELLSEPTQEGVDFGPYALADETGHAIWIGGLPIEGIADALQCLAREHQLPSDRMEEAWANFGKTWRR